jgi:hypothetical protein
MAKTYSKLRGRIVEKYVTVGDFLTALGWQKNYFYRRWNGSVDWTIEDMKQIAELLEIPESEIFTFFKP